MANNVQLEKQWLSMSSNSFETLIQRGQKMSKDKLKIIIQIYIYYGISEFVFFSFL